MKFSVDDPVRLLRKLHGINPKADTHFVVRLPGEQMEIAPPCVTRSRVPNELEIHGNTKEALERLSQTLQFYKSLQCEVEMVTSHRVSDGAGSKKKKRIKLNLNNKACTTSDLLVALPFLSPDNILWRIEVRFESPNARPDSLWTTNKEVQRLLRAQPAVAENLSALKQGDLEVALRQ
jgi:hypothetical protein